MSAQAHAQLASIEVDQNPLDRFAKVTVEGVDLNNALISLQTRSGISLVFSPSKLPRLPVTCHCYAVTVSEALDRLLAGTGLRYSVHGEHVVIETSVLPAYQAVQPAFPLVAGTIPTSPLKTVSVSMPAAALEWPRDQRAAPTRPAQGTIVGTVVGSRDLQPLAAVQVSIPGTGFGTLTNAQGRYTLVDVPAGEVRVAVSLIGYSRAEESVAVVSGATHEVNFQLALDALALDEIVVTGTPGGTRRAALGHTVGNINAGELTEVAPVRNAMELISMRNPGVSVMPGSGLVGGIGAPINIRGLSSIGLSNEPIIFIDGIKMNSEIEGGSGPGSHQVHRINDIAAEDIESIEIIKGPSAATLYGSEASNGVIQIITKRGAAGTPVIEASAQLGSTWFPDPVRYTGYHYAFLPGTTQLDSVNLYEHERDLGEGELFQKGFLQYYNASIRGGNDNTRYFISFDWDDEQGILEQNWGNKFAGRGNVDIQIRESVNARVSTSYMQRTTAIPTAEHVTAPLNMLVFGKHPIQSPETRGFSGATPEEAAKIQNWTDTRRFTGSINLNHDPTEWFDHRFTIGLDLTESQDNLLFPRHELGERGPYGTRGLGERRVDKSTQPMYTVDYSGTGSFDITDQLRTSTSAGFQYYITQREDIEGDGLVFAAPPLTTLGAAASTSSTGDWIENKTVGVYLQQQVDFRDRLYLTGGLRADDNSAFGAEFETAIYPKISLAWVLHEEPFWRAVAPWVPSFRFRSAYGAAGQQPSIFAAARLYNPTPGPEGTATVTPGVIGNPQLEPERGEELELGFEAALLNDRLTVDYTWYHKATRDAIVSQNLPPSVGFPGARFVNLGRVTNWGHELALNGELLSGPRLDWSSGLTFTWMDNRVEDLGPGVDRVGSHRVGEPMNKIYSLKVVSADFVSGNSGPTTNEMCVGGPEVNHAPVPCSEAPDFDWGRATPTWEAGVHSTLTLFSNLALYARIEGRGGHRKGDTLIEPRLTPFNSTRHSILQDDPVIQAYRKYNRQPYGYFDAGFIRLREVSVTYTAPADLASVVGASRATLSFQARNIKQLWRAGTRTLVGNAYVPEPEVGGRGSFGSQGQYPQMPVVLTSIRFSF